VAGKRPTLLQERFPLSSAQNPFLLQRKERYTSALLASADWPNRRKEARMTLIEEALAMPGTDNGCKERWIEIIHPDNRAQVEDALVTHLVESGCCL
jgi:hypothetical protein